MPATVLEALQDDGTYPDLYYGKNLLDEVPQDLYKQDWWYRTSFEAPAGHTAYLLELPGINYRAEIWLNGHMVADNTQIVGMHNAHELDVARWILPGQPNTLAIKVTPERSLQDINGVELADSWWDWINWNYLGYQGPGKNPDRGNSFVSDRNAGIWNPVYLKVAGEVSLGSAVVNTELPLPRTDSARLTIHTSVHNYSTRQVRGVLKGTISRAGKPTVDVEQPVTLLPGEQREVTLSPDKFDGLTVANPDLWWPYTLGKPDLYDLRMEFTQFGQVSDTSDLRFGIRTVSQHRDDDGDFPDLGTGGTYLTVNGKDFLVRGTAYTPDLLYDYDPAREDAILGYVKDLGLNMLRLEGKFPGEHIVEKADELGIPLMYGWMCCNQWEKWSQWDAEDHRVAKESLRSQILMLRSHPSAFIWANGSDGRPPPDILAKYHAILDDSHWQNATVDTVSSLARDANGEREWDGIHMEGPYSWRPPGYWFSGRYGATRGSTAEQGDNEHIPPFASLKKFIPPDKLWPINDTWYFHVGSNPNNETLDSIQRAVDRRYGPSDDAEEFARKAQLAHYESTRAVRGLRRQRMGEPQDDHLLDAEQPLALVLRQHLRLLPASGWCVLRRQEGASAALGGVRLLRDGRPHEGARDPGEPDAGQTVGPSRAGPRLRPAGRRAGRPDDRRPQRRLGRKRRGDDVAEVARDSSIFFVRCEVLDHDGTVLAENVYWQSQQRDDLGDPTNDWAFELKQVSWANMTALNWMPRVPLQVSAKRTGASGEDGVTIRLRNPTQRVAFFERAEMLTTPNGDEILPIEYSDNYVTVFPGETVEPHGVMPPTARSPSGCASPSTTRHQWWCRSNRGEVPCTRLTRTPSRWCGACWRKPRTGCG